MKSKGEIRPGGITAAGAKVGIGVAIFFLLFGLVLFTVVMGEQSSSELGLTVLIALFFLGFFAVCLAMLRFYLRVIKAARPAAEGSIAEFRLESDDTAPKGSENFAERLRQLESLKKDGLISDTEYRQKREAILHEPW